MICNLLVTATFICRDKKICVLQYLTHVFKRRGQCCIQNLLMDKAGLSVAKSVLES